MSRRRIVMISPVGGIAMASAIADLLAAQSPDESDIDFVTPEEWDERLFYGDGTGDLLGIIPAAREIVYVPVKIPDLRYVLEPSRPGKDPDRHRPRDQYRNKKQGWKPRS